MNDEFAWRKNLGGLDKPVEPTRDLWPLIRARIDAAPARRARWSHRRWVIAAVAVLAVGFAGALVLWQRLAPVPLAQMAPTARPVAVTDASASARTALAWAVPTDPVLASAARQLDLASANLHNALQQRPDAVFLVGLLNRTNSQRMRLLREPYAG